MSFIENSYLKQSNHYTVKESEINNRFSLNSIDRWRHGRMYDTVLPLIKNMNDKWLTIGDGRYGSDSIFLKERGVKQILPTDLSETLLKVAKEINLIEKYQLENAENLSFEDDEFDWLFCKEAYHHFPRPMIAVYEMLRVAKKGVIFIEPNDQIVDCAHTSSLGNALLFSKRTLINRIKKTIGKTEYYPFGGYEESGNYIYTISEREFEKVALGINLPWIAFKGLVDYYEAGFETEIAEDSNPKFNRLKKFISNEENKALRGKRKHNILVSIIGKEVLDEELEVKLKAHGFKVVRLPRNPFL